MKRITIPFLIVIFTLIFTISAFALIRPSATAEWKEDILTLLSLVKRVGDYSEVVDLIEVAPALKKDPEIRKAFITFAPPGATPPEWAREEEIAPPVRIEVPEKIATAKTPKEKERREIKEKEAQKIAQEVAAQRKVREREAAPPEIIKEEPKIETPKEVAIIEGPPEKIGIVEEAPAKEALKEELEIISTPLPSGAKVVHSTDVVSRVEAIEEGGKIRVVITLSGERKYTVSERSRPPSIIINIPHTINAVFPGRIMVNQGCVRMIEVTQYRSTPFDEARITVILNRGTEYRVTHKDNEIYIDFEE
ncbi:AMIN domain-containing protein [bacterium]|nr:AMIN domain-containing protein [bacterium]